MTIRKQIFKVGEYPQGSFPTEKVKQIFENTKEKVSGIFSHTSKLLQKNRNPVELGSLSNFEFNEADGTIAADVEFNEKGAMYYEDGSLSGMSIELRDGAIDKVAFLPLGVTPQIPEAEFSDEGNYSLAVEFQAIDVPVLTPEQLLQAIIAFDVADCPVPLFRRMQDEWWNKADVQDYANILKDKGYSIVKDEVDQQEFSKVELEELLKQKEEQVKAELKIKQESILEFERMKREGYVTKAMEDAGFTSDLLGAIRLNENSNKVLEFDDKTMNFGVIENILKAVPKMSTESILREFNEHTKEDKPLSLLEIAKLKGRA